MTNGDYYEVLGVSRKATPRDIRRAYRALARKYHPDLHPDDKAASQKFREIQEAYEVLKDSRKRKAYEYYGPRFGHRIPAGSVDSAKQQGAPHGDVPFGFGRYTSGDARTNAPFPRTGRFSSPATYRVWLGTLTFAALLVGTFIYLLFLLPNRGVREFKRAQEALRHVNSWKMEGQDFVQEVACPSRERYTRHIRRTIGGTPFELTLDTIIIAHKEYIYSRKTWVLQGFSATDPSDACAMLVQGEDARDLPPLGEWLGSSNAIEKENLRETTDGECREWKIHSPGRLSRNFQTYEPPKAEFVCLGVKDHLPRFQGTPGNPQEIRYYDWNVPVDIPYPISEPSRAECRNGECP